MDDSFEVLDFSDDLESMNESVRPAIYSSYLIKATSDPIREKSIQEQSSDTGKKFQNTDQPSATEVTSLNALEASQMENQINEEEQASAKENSEQATITEGDKDVSSQNLTAEHFGSLEKDGESKKEDDEVQSENDLSEDEFEAAYKVLKRITDEMIKVTKVLKLRPRLISPLNLGSEAIERMEEDTVAERFIYELSALFPEFLESFAQCYGTEVHPIDVRNVVFSGATEELRSFLGRNLHELRLAVPFLLKNNNGSLEKLSFINALSAITFKSEIDGTDILLADELLPIVSFARIGNLLTRSKSDLINQFLMKNNQRVFYTEAMPNGDLTKVTQDGTVDLAWHLQSHRNKPKSVIFNAHGDLAKHKNLFTWLAKVSNTLVIFIERAPKSNAVASIEEIVRIFTCCRVILFPLKKMDLDVEGLSPVPFTKWNNNRIVKYLESNIYDEYSANMLKSLTSIVSESNDLFDKMTKIDLNFVTESELVIAFLKHLNEADQMNTNWKDYVKLAKQFYRAKPSETKSIITVQTETNNQKARKAGEIQKNASVYLQHINNFCVKLLEAHNRDPNFGIYQVFSTLNFVQRDKIFRTIAQTYEVQNPLEITKSKALDLMATMLLDGHSIELLDGTNGWIYTNWITNLFKRLEEMLPKAKVVIISVLGVQSSFKSTILNVMFGLSFRTSLGRCTDGVHATLLELDPRLQTVLGYSHVLVIDVEGLQSVEKRDESGTSSYTSHDNELATAIICMSDLCLINIKGENTAEMEGILDICMFAVARMKLIKVSCKTAFVHQNVCGVNVKDETKNLRAKINIKLEEAKKIVIEQEGETIDTEYLNKCFGIDLENFAFYLPNYKNDGSPKGVYQKQYTEKIAEMKGTVLMLLKGSGVSFFEVGDRICSMWQSILHEKFIFNFNNAIDLHVNRGIEREYNKTMNQFNSIMMEVEKLLRMCIDTNNCQSDMNKMVEDKIDETKERLELEFSEFFDQEPHTDIKCESRDSYVKKLQLEMINAIQDQINRLTRYRSINKLEKLLKGKKVDFENRFLDICRANAQELVAALPEEREEMFNRLFKEEKVQYLNESQIVLESYDNRPIKDYLERKLHDLFEDVQDYDKIIKKYAKWDCSIERSSMEIKDTIHYKKPYWFGLVRILMPSFSQCDFISTLVSQVTNEVHAFFQTNEFVNCGVCKLSIDQTVDKIKEIVEEEIKSSPFNKYFCRDFTYYMAFEVFLRDLQRMRDDFAMKHDPERLIDKIKPTLREIFQNFCENRSQISTIFKQLTDSLNEAIELKILKLKEETVRSSMLKSLGKMQKIQLINLILLEKLKGGKEDCFEEIMPFLTDPVEFIRSFIRQKSEEEADSEELHAKTTELKRKIVDTLKDALKSSKLKNSTLETMEFGEWLKLFNTKFPTSTIELNFVDLNCLMKLEIREFSEFNKKIEDLISYLEEDFHVPLEEMSKMFDRIVQEITNSVIGCRCKCPICGAICDTTVPNHYKRHYSSNHSSICLKHKICKGRKLLSESCYGSINSDVAKELADGNKELLKSFDGWNFKVGNAVKPFWIWFIQNNVAKIEEKHHNVPVDLNSALLKENVTYDAAVESLINPYQFKAYDNFHYHCNIL